MKRVKILKQKNVLIDEIVDINGKKLNLSFTLTPDGKWAPEDKRKGLTME